MPQIKPLFFASDLIRRTPPNQLASWKHSPRFCSLLCRIKTVYKRVPLRHRCYGPKPEWYTRMVPSGLLPAVKIDGQLITESMDIMIQLEAQFPERPLLPAPGSQESKSLQVRIRSKTGRTASGCSELRRSCRSACEWFSLPHLALGDMTPLEQQLWPGSWQTPLISRHLRRSFVDAVE